MEYKFSVEKVKGTSRYRHRTSKTSRNFCIFNVLVLVYLRPAVPAAECKIGLNHFRPDFLSAPGLGGRPHIMSAVGADIFFVSLVLRVYRGSVLRCTEYRHSCIRRDD